jgi:hypothetical protein
MNYSGSVFDHALQNMLSCCLLSKSVKNEVHNIIVKSVVFYACKNWGCLEQCFEDRIWAKKEMTKLEKII